VELHVLKNRTVEIIVSQRYEPGFDLEALLHGYFRIHTVKSTFKEVIGAMACLNVDCIGKHRVSASEGGK